MLWAFVGFVHTLHISIRFNDQYNSKRPAEPASSVPATCQIFRTKHRDKAQATTALRHVSAHIHIKRDTEKTEDCGQERCEEMLRDRAILGHLKSSATFWSPMVKGTCFLSMKYKHSLERHQHQVLKGLHVRMMVHPCRRLTMFSEVNLRKNDVESPTRLPKCQCARSTSARTCAKDGTWTAQNLCVFA